MKSKKKMVYWKLCPKCGNMEVHYGYPKISKNIACDDCAKAGAKK